MSWRRHLHPALADLTAYDVPPAGPEQIRLHANECPLPWPEEVVADLAQRVRAVELNRYPDTSGRALRAILAARHGVEPARVLVSNGSDELIGLLCKALSGGPSPVLVTPRPTFVMYGHAAALNGLSLREVPLTAELDLDEPALDRALAGANLAFFARPNNPTSSLFDAGAIERLSRGHPDVVFAIDEAYAAYRPGCTLLDPQAPPTRVHLGTLSKIGLAALRVGYCIAAPELIAELDKLRQPYNVSATSLAIAERVLTRHAAVLDALIAQAVAQRDALVELLARLRDATVYPAHANLVLVRLWPPERAPALAAALAARGVLVKLPTGAPELAGCLRVSIGTPAEQARLAEGLAELGELL